MILTETTYNARIVILYKEGLAKHDQVEERYAIMFGNKSTVEKNEPPTTLLLTYTNIWLYTTLQSQNTKYTIIGGALNNDALMHT